MHISDVTVAVPCPKCEGRLRESFARVETDPILICRACETRLEVRAKQISRDLQQIGHLIADFQRRRSTRYGETFA